MSTPVQDFAVDEIGRFYICDDEGNPYSGPYDTLDEAYAALVALESNDDQDA